MLKILRMYTLNEEGNTKQKKDEKRNWKYKKIRTKNTYPKVKPNRFIRISWRFKNHNQNDKN